ncbi:MAG: hypothetical protein M3271_03030 [Actinomycetota bacterium]|nr:hypothetical protein [Actinomycetota bacterium]
MSDVSDTLRKGHMRRAAAWAAAVTAAAAFGGPTAATPLPTAPDCRIFPGSNVWNRRVDELPVHDRSRALIRSIGRAEGLHPDFGSGLYEGGPIGIPITVVGDGQRKSRVRFRYASESDKGPYPIPKDVKIEGGRKSTGDRHAVIVHRDECRLYELFALRRREGRWRAGSGAIWDLDSNELRPRGWTSADAAGLPILPGLARWDEVKKGAIDHALRFTASRTRAKYIYPARHHASDSDDRDLPPMGLRLRLKKGFSLAGYPRQAKIVLVALKRYGMILADNGSDWYISGAPNRHWDNDALHTLGDVKGSDFVVVDTSNLRPWKD